MNLHTEIRFGRTARTTALALGLAVVAGLMIFRHLRIERSWQEDFPAPLANHGVLPVRTFSFAAELKPYVEELNAGPGPVPPHFSPAPRHAIELLPGPTFHAYYDDPQSGLELVMLGRNFPGRPAYFLGWREGLDGNWRQITAPGAQWAQGSPVPVPARGENVILSAWGQPSRLVEVDFRRDLAWELCRGHSPTLSPDRKQLAFFDDRDRSLAKSSTCFGIHDLYVWDFEAGHITRVTRLTDTDWRSGQSWGARWSRDSRVLFVTGSAREHGQFRWLYDSQTGRLQSLPKKKWGD